MSRKGSRTADAQESNSTGWFVGINVALALLFIGYLVFSANSGPSTTTSAISEEQPLQFTVLEGSTLVGFDGDSMILKSSDGGCYSVAKSTRDALWYAQEAACPAATAPAN